MESKVLRLLCKAMISLVISIIALLLMCLLFPYLIYIWVASIISNVCILSVIWMIYIEMCKLFPPPAMRK